MLEKLIYIVQLIGRCIRRYVTTMECHGLLCFKSLVAHVVCDSIEFPGDVSVGYRALQMLFQFPDLV